MKPKARAAVVALLLLTPAGVAAIVWKVRSAAVPLARSAHLRGVVEPITMVDGISWDDGGSQGLAFRDAGQVVRYACLMNDLDGVQNLVLGSVYPGKESSVPVGGVEERAFLGLLERWSRRDPEARIWTRRIERHAARVRAGDRVSILTGGETEQERGNLFAVGILRKLRKRN